MRRSILGFTLLVATSAGAACLPPPSGLDAWWAGEDNAGDALGGSGGSLVGNVDFTEGRIGRAFRFAGDGARVDLHGAALADGASRAFSVALWMRPAALGPNTYLLGRSQPDSGLGWDLRHDGTRLQLIGLDGWAFNLVTDELLEVDVWRHVALVAGSDSGGEADVSLYVDGVLVGTTGRSAVSASPNPFRLGHTSNFGGTPYAGELDEVQLFDRALDAGEVAALAAAADGLCAFCALLPEDRFGWWPAEDDTLDASGSADGVAGGQLAFADGVVWRAFDLDGDSFVELPPSPDWNLGTASFTATAWFRTASDGYRNLVRHHDGGPSGGLWGLRVIPGGQLQFLISSFAEGQLDINSEATVTDGRWHSVAAVRDAEAGEIRLYLDGRPASAPVADSGRDVTGTASYRLLIGAGGWGGGGIFESFIGQIDEIAFHRRVLSEDEILALATADGAGVCLDCAEASQMPSAWWSFEGNDGERIQNLEGILRNGAGFAPGRVGQALAVDFDTLQSSLEVAHHPSLAFTAQQPMAVTLWAQRGSDHGAQHLFSKRLDCFATPWNYQLAWESGPDRLCFGSDAGYVCTTADQLPRDVWTHLGLSFDGEEGVIFVNGEPKARAAMQLGPDSGQPPLRIGDVADCDWLGQGFRGLIDEFAIHSRALSRDEVYREFAAGAEGRCLGLTEAIFADGFEPLVIKRAGDCR